MKSYLLLSFGISMILLSGCLQTRYITERYIKTNIENHKEGNFSSIKTYSIFQGASISGGSYLELTGYKNGSTKGLVIGADKIYAARQKFKGDQTLLANITFVELSLAQCKSILDKYKLLQEKIKLEKPIINEEIYSDYTVSKDLFISFKISKINRSVTFIDFWIDGEKYHVSTKTIMKKLNKFINY